MFFQSGVLRMTLNRKDAGYGFSLIHGERGTSTALFVRTITPGGAADDDGQLHVRDRLLQVKYITQFSEDDIVQAYM